MQQLNTTRNYAAMLVAIATLFTGSALAQNYNTALGIRGGGNLGITLQQRIGDKSTVEGIVQYGIINKQTMATALLEKHIGILGRGANFYVGAGPHVGWYGNAEQKTTGNNMFYGASGIIGGELKFKRIVFSADYKPAFNLAGGNNVFNGQTGISVRYILIPAPKRDGLLQKIKNGVPKINLPGRKNRSQNNEGSIFKRRSYNEDSY